jgi:hypothetical protein
LSEVQTRNPISGFNSTQRIPSTKWTRGSLRERSNFINISFPINWFGASRFAVIDEEEIELSHFGKMIVERYGHKY